MSARKKPSRRPATGKLALKLALAVGIAAASALLLVGVLLVNNLDAAVPAAQDGMVRTAFVLAFVMALLGGLGVAVFVYFQAGGITSRLTELGLSVAKLGRGNEVRVKVSGNDEIAALGRSIHYLASDLASLAKGDDEEGTLQLAFDPQLRDYRDRTIPNGLEGMDGIEADAALSPGSRGGLDYFDGVVKDGRVVVFLCSAEGAGATAAIAVRMARDELLRALGTGANARKVLSHTNRVLHKNLPRGACAVATVIQVENDEAKIYQAGARVPVLQCARGEVTELESEGLALGLDEGPVFEKGLRPQKLDLVSGTRLVVLNDAGMRQPDVVDIVADHSPKHTAPFMNMVLGNIEEEAGDEGLREDVVLITVKKS